MDNSLVGEMMMTPVPEKYLILKKETLDKEF